MQEEIGDRENSGTGRQKKHTPHQATTYLFRFSFELLYFFCTLMRQLTPLSLFPIFPSLTFFLSVSLTHSLSHSSFSLSVTLSHSLCLCVSVCLHICLSVCLSLSLSLFLLISLSFSRRAHVVCVRGIGVLASMYVSV